MAMYARGCSVEVQDGSGPKSGLKGFEKQRFSERMPGFSALRPQGPDRDRKFDRSKILSRRSYFVVCRA